MVVLEVCEMLGWVQVLSGGRKYTCPMTIIDNEQYFHFKGEYHRVEDYLY